MTTAYRYLVFTFLTLLAFGPGCVLHSQPVQVQPLYNAELRSDLNADGFSINNYGQEGGELLYVDDTGVLQRPALTIGTGTTLTYSGDGVINARTVAGTTPGAGGLLLLAKTSIEDVLEELNLENVDNTSDADKPVSTATQTALDRKATIIDESTVWEDLEPGGRYIWLGGESELPILEGEIENVTVTNSGTGMLVLEIPMGVSTVYILNPGNTVKFDVVATGVGENHIHTNITVTGGELSNSEGIPPDVQTVLDSKVGTSLTLTAGTGLTGGGNLTANRTFSLSSGSIASLALADTAVQPDTLTTALLGKANVIDFDGRFVIHVSKGDAATDEREGVPKYDRDRPFETIYAAIQAASSGDVIAVGPGTYSEHVRMAQIIETEPDVWEEVPTTNVNLLLSESTIVQGPGVDTDASSSALYIFGGATCYVRGGHFMSASGYGVYISGEGTEVDFKADATGYVGIYASSNAVVSMEGNFTSPVYDAVWVNEAGPVHIRNSMLRGGGNALEAFIGPSGGPVTVDTSILEAVYEGDSAEAALHIPAGGDVFIYNSRLSNAPGSTRGCVMAITHDDYAQALDLEMYDTHLVYKTTSGFPIETESDTPAISISMTGGSVTSLSSEAGAVDITGVASITIVNTQTNKTFPSGTVGSWTDASGNLVVSGEASASVVRTPMIVSPIVLGGTGTTSSLVLKSTSGVGTTGADITLAVGNDGATTGIKILNNGNVGIGTPTSISNGLTISKDITSFEPSSASGVGRIDFYGKSGGTRSASQGNIAAGAWTSGGGLDIFAVGALDLVGAETRFYTAAGGVLSMTIANTTGRVGIGAPSPSSQLHVKGSPTGSGNYLMRLENDTAWNGNEPYSLYVNGYTYLNGFRISGSGVRGIYLVSGNMDFATNNGVISFTSGGLGMVERMRIVGTTGDVGIGIDAPGARLHVVSTTEQLRLGYDASNYYSTTVSSTGGVTFNAVGSGSAFTFSDAVTATNLSGTNTGDQDLSGKADKAISFVTDATTARVLVLTDADKYVRMTNTDAKTVEVPPQASVVWADGTVVTIRNAGAGAMTFVEGAGVTITPDDLEIEENGTTQLIRVAEDTWDAL